MAQEMDPGTRAKYLRALENGIAERTDTYVTYNRRSQDFIRMDLGSDPRLLTGRMYTHVLGGGSVKRVSECGNAEDYQNEFHDDLVFEFKKREIYVETIFSDDDDPDGCHITVVSVKEHKK